MLLSKYYVMCQIAAYILFCHDCYRFFLNIYTISHEEMLSLLN